MGKSFFWWHDNYCFIYVWMFVRPTTEMACGWLGTMPCNYTTIIWSGEFSFIDSDIFLCITVDSRLRSETTTVASMTSIIRLKAWNQCWVSRSSAGTKSMWPLWPWHRRLILLLPSLVQMMDFSKRFVFVFSEWPIVHWTAWKLTLDDPCFFICSYNGNAGVLCI